MQLTALRLTRKPTLKLAGIRKSYEVHTWDESDELYTSNSGPRILEIEGGAVFVDGNPIVDAQFENDGLTWSQKTADYYTSGAIHFTPDGMAFGGVVHLGKDELTATAHYVSGVTPPTIYETQVAKSASGDGSETGVTVTLGYEYVSMNQLPTPVIKFDSEDVTSIVTLTINPKNQALQLEIPFYAPAAAVAAESCELWPASGKIEFAWDGESFTGSMKKYDKKTGDESKNALAWKGKARPMAAPLKAARLAAPKLLTVSTLSIAELMSISPEGVDELAMQMLIENTKWAMNENWLRDFFGESKPVLDPTRIEVIKKDEKFYTEKFAPVYLGWGIANMAGTGAPKRPLSDNEKRKLKYYMHNGVAKEEGYNKQNQALYLQAFVRASPKLREYIADGGPKWAEQLYNAITTVPQINIMINRIVGTGDMELATRYTNLLAALQPVKAETESFASKYQELLACKGFAYIAPDVKLDDEKDIMRWLPSIIGQFIEQYITLPSNPTREEIIRHEMALQLQAASIELGSINKLSGAIANTLAAAPGTNIVNRVQNAAQSWQQRYPKVAKLSRFFFTAVWCYGLTNAIAGFKKWEELDDIQKGRLVVSTVQLFGKLILAIPTILESTAWGFAKIAEVQNFFSKTRNVAEVGQALVQVERRWMARAAASLRETVTAARAADTTMGKVFNNIAKIGRWLSVLVAAGFATLATIEFVKALQNGDSTMMDKAFTGIIACSAILETVCVVGALFVASQVFAIAGAVLAVIGLIFTLVEMFRPRPEPESPVDTFNDKTLRPFAQALPEPPADWKPKDKLSFFESPLIMAAG